MKKQIYVAALLALAASGLGLAADAPPSPKSNIQITQFVTPAPKPDYDKEVLAPLYAAQEAARAAEAARIAKEAQLAREAATAAQKASAPATVIWPVQADSAKAFIYAHESGNNPAAVNAGGCRGLGQACPGSKLPCSDSDYACQDAFFTAYMTARYGTWQNAYAFWVAHHWW